MSKAATYNKEFSAYSINTGETDAVNINILNIFWICLYYMMEHFLKLDPDPPVSRRLSSTSKVLSMVKLPGPRSADDPPPLAPTP